MATKKPVAPAPKAAKKSTSTALTVWEEEMAQEAVAQGATENAVGGFKSISTKSGILSVDDNAVEDNELRVIILASIHENQLYAGEYDSSTPTTPICYAFGKTEEGMGPHEAAPDKQASACEGCPNNEWGSADKGRGKACKNVRRLLCITEDSLESAETLAEAEPRMLKLPVMSVKNWTNYVKNVLAEDVKRASYGVVTLIKVVPDAKSQFKVTFRFEEVVNFDQALWDGMKKKVKEANNNIANAYPVFEEEEKPQSGGKRVIPIKSAGARKTPAGPAKRGSGKY